VEKVDVRTWTGVDCKTAEAPQYLVDQNRAISGVDVTKYQQEPSSALVERSEGILEPLTLFYPYFTDIERQTEIE
jgi:hypothetical protein